jgi:hypothetical protein
VQEAPRLRIDRREHVGVAMAGGRDRDAGRAIEKGVAVHVLDNRARGALDDERVAACVGG